VTILNIVVIGGMNIYFNYFSIFIFRIAFIGLYLSSFSGIVSYFPDRYVNALVIGTVGVNYNTIVQGCPEPVELKFSKN